MWGTQQAKRVSQKGVQRGFLVNVVQAGAEQRGAGLLAAERVVEDVDLLLQHCAVHLVLAAVVEHNELDRHDEARSVGDGVQPVNADARQRCLVKMQSNTTFRFCYHTCGCH